MIRDRIHGALFGVAVGDALGGNRLNLEPGEVTDDTQISLCVAEGIIIAPENPIAEIGSRFIVWHNTRPKDVGRACEYAIRNATRNSRKSGKIANTNAWFEAAKEVDSSLDGLSVGNGALKRTVYTGLFYGAGHTKFTADIAKMTHWSEESTEACVLYSEIIARFTAGASIEATREILQGTRYADGRKSYSPTGDVVDCLGCALNSLFSTKTFKDAVMAAVNLGGDSDTIGAITGGLAGALYGYQAIPEDWAAALPVAVSKRLEKLAERACEQRSLNLN